MNKEKQQLKQIWIIAFALFLLAMPLVFAWHIEIGWDVKEHGGYTNGWVVKDVLQIYHIHLYSLLLINSFASGYILYNSWSRK